jgi:aspartyl-tRNA(Asn)/glutamyl-tRNA(Gln) amidotransferase subunit A
MMGVWKPVAELAADVQAGSVTAAELVEKSLAAIEQHQEYNAIISLTAERARVRAKDVDERIAKGEKVGKLAGVPFIAKDNFLTFGGETTAASNILKGFEAPYQATAIEKLEAEGAICVAKANLDAFGHGGSTENSDFMVTKNAHDKERVPGGSSGGSATAVVLELAPFSIGTDTGGSIRQPSSLSGCVGLKPTYGLVSRSGVIAMISSTDTIGPLARTVADVALVLDIMAGKDPLDGTTIDRDSESYVVGPKTENIAGRKIGVIKEYMGEGLDLSVRRQIETAIDKLKQSGVEIIEVSLPSLSLALACYYILCPAEVSSNLSRYDGQHFGFADKSAENLEQSFSLSRSMGFGNEAKRRIMIGTYVLSSGYYDAYYKKAQQLRTKLIEEFETAYKQVEFLVGPVAPTQAFKIGENTDNPLHMYLSDVMTVAPSLVGIPSMSLPVGSINNLPVGMQIMAPQRRDRQLLMMAHEVERLLA